LDKGRVETGQAAWLHRIKLGQTGGGSIDPKQETFLYGQGVKPGSLR
jgi:hypothetical protein